MSETPGNSDLTNAAAQGAAEAVNEVIAEEQQAAQVDAALVTSEIAADVALEAQETAETAGAAAAVAGEIAMDSAEVSEATAEVAIETAGTVSDQQQQLAALGERFTAWDAKLDSILSRLPEPQTEKQQVTEVTVGANRDDNTESGTQSAPRRQSRATGNGSTPERTSRHGRRRR